VRHGSGRKKISKDARERDGAGQGTRVGFLVDKLQTLLMKLCLRGRALYKSIRFERGDL
jgi:hypothetical protein